MTQDVDPAEKPRIKRHVVSEIDGTREGGLAFTISLILGLVAASLVHPLALSSFWVWCAVLTAAVGIMVNVQRLFDRRDPTDVEMDV